ncbi:MarR family winged helix-turn-helix transcriptional regulator [Polymorphospora rubra]|nr:MarR family transcriptional regulator [Polymorphospora rubra]
MPVPGPTASDGGEITGQRRADEESPVAPAAHDMPSADDVDSAMALIQLSGLVQGTFGRVADRHDLTAVQGRLLCVLAQQPRGMAELARIFGVGKANLTGLVDRAAQRGLVERTLVPGDRRAVHVILTEDGRRLAAAFHYDVTRELAGALSPLTAEARAGLQESALAITHAAGHTGAWGPCQAC